MKSLNLLWIAEETCTETFDDRKPAMVADGVGADPLGQFFVVTEFIDANNHGGLSILKQELRMANISKRIPRRLEMAITPPARFLIRQAS